MLGQQAVIHMARGAFRVLQETDKARKQGQSESMCGIAVSPNKEVAGAAILEVWTSDGRKKRREYDLIPELAKAIIDTSNRNKNILYQ